MYDDEKPSWHFFLHYGFVPPRNPHEEAVLFGSTEEAVAWYLHRFPIAKVGAGEDDGDSSHMGPSKVDLSKPFFQTPCQKPCFAPFGAY